MPKSIAGQAVFILVLTYKPDFNTGKLHPHRHHCLNFFVGLFIYFYSQICLLILCQSTTTLSLLFILSRDVLPTSGFSTPSAGCFQLHMKSSTISLPKERVSSITPQSKEWQNLKLFRDSFPFSLEEPQLVQTRHVSRHQRKAPSANESEERGRNLTTNWFLAQFKTLETGMLNKHLSSQHPPLLGLAVTWKNAAVQGCSITYK